MKHPFISKKALLALNIMVCLGLLTGLVNLDLGAVVAAPDAQTLDLHPADRPAPPRQGLDMGESSDIFDPTMDVAPLSEEIWGYDFLANSEVTLSINSMFMATRESDTSGYVYFDLGGLYDIVPGDTVTLSAGVDSATHVVTTIAFSAVDLANDEVRGTAVVGSEISTYAYDGSNPALYEWDFPDTDGAGNWTSVYETVDLMLGSKGWVMQTDTSNNRTCLGWEYDPILLVARDESFVVGMNWLVNTELTLELGAHTDTQTVDMSGRVLFDVLDFGVPAGQEVSLSDGDVTKTHIVTGVTITGISQAAGTVSGTSNVSGFVNLRACDEYCEWKGSTPGGSNNWSVDFSGSIPIVPGSQGVVLQFDDDNDSTLLLWNVPENDNINHRTYMPRVPYESTIKTLGATNTSNEPSFSACGGPGLASVWYLYVATTDGEMTLDTFGSNYNTMLGVWFGEPGSLTLVKCNNDAAGTQQSQVNFKYLKDVVYYIGVAQKGSTETGGALKLHATTFQDVNGTHPLWRYVEGFFAKGITTGCAVNPMRYCPDRGVTRAEMAVFLLRSMHADDPTPYEPKDVDPDPFADVPAAGKDWMEPWIEQFYALGVTTGCGVSGTQLLFCPERGVTRAEMAVFMLRAKGITPVDDPSNPFIDVPVPGKAWMEPWIETFYNEGYTTGCGTAPHGKLLYCPERGANRAEMATFIDRIFGFSILP